MQTFIKKYDENVKVAKACGQSPDRKLKTLMHGRPLMVGPIINEKVRTFMVLLYKKGGHVSKKASAYEACDRTCTPFHMPKTLETCKKNHTLFN